MDLDFLDIILLLGIIQGMILALLIFFDRKKGRVSNRLLGTLIEEGKR